MKIRLLTEAAYNRIITLKETMSKKDRGYGVHESNIPPKNRARQNVVFEHGYLMAKLGRENVCSLVKGEIETPNDISGVVYVPFDENSGWKNSVAKELTECDYKINTFC